jgi:RNA polymerase sigma factor (sigma-70 family)
MPHEGSITRWIADLRAGQSRAAEKLWEQYYERLVRLAGQKLRSAQRRVADEEDAVVSAFDSFCRGAQAGRFPQLDDRDDLWQVLVMLTARKLANQLKHQRREKRGGGQVRGESVFIAAEDRSAGIDQIVGSAPTPEFAAEVGEECRRLLALLPDDTLRAVALAKMEGYQNAEIAQRQGVKTRTIERKLQLIRELWSGAEFPLD